MAKIPIPAYVRVDPRYGIVKVDAHTREVDLKSLIGTNASKRWHQDGAPSFQTISESASKSAAELEGGTHVRSGTGSSSIAAVFKEDHIQVNAGSWDSKSVDERKMLLAHEAGHAIASDLIVNQRELVDRFKVSTRNGEPMYHISAPTTENKATLYGDPIAEFLANEAAMYLTDNESEYEDPTRQALQEAIRQSAAKIGLKPLPDTATQAPVATVERPEAPSQPAPISESGTISESLIERVAKVRRMTHNYRLRGQQMQEEQKAVYDEYGTLHKLDNGDVELPKELDADFDWVAEQKRYEAMYGRDEGQARFYSRVSYIRDSTLLQARLLVDEGYISGQQANTLWEQWKAQIPCLPIPKKMQQDGEALMRELSSLGDEVRKQMLDSLDESERTIVRVLADKYENVRHHMDSVQKLCGERTKATWENMAAVESALGRSVANLQGESEDVWEMAEQTYGPVRQKVFTVLTQLRKGYGESQFDYDDESQQLVDGFVDEEHILGNILTNMGRVYPKEWVDQANASGALHLEDAGERGRYVRFHHSVQPQRVGDDFPVLADPETGEMYQMSSVMIHEMSHHIAQGNPNISMLLAILFQMRAEGEPMFHMSELTGLNYAPSEVSIPDKWGHAYMGLDYTKPTNAPEGAVLSENQMRAIQMQMVAGSDEILSMLMERLFTGHLGGTLEGDADDEINLLIGLLVGM